MKAPSFVIVLCALSSQVHAEIPGRIPYAPWSGMTLLGNPCWGTSKGYGPFDYNRTTPENRQLVEGAHFTPEVEQLIRGSRGYLWGDLDYTLMALPNNHRALWAYSRYYLRDKRSEDQKRRDETQQKGLPPPECYFIRAMKAVPDDATVPAVFGIYLHRRGMPELALKQYQKAERKLPGDPELAYNIGLLYYDMGRFDLAAQYADKAKKLGYPLGGLAKKLANAHSDSTKSPPGK